MPNRYVLALTLLAGCTAVAPRAEMVPAQPLERPVVVVGGFLDWGGHTYLAREIRNRTGDGRVIAVTTGFQPSFDAAARQVTRAVGRYFPSDVPGETVEVDVIGHSMGGLVARHAAAAHPDGRARLNVGRMFTVVTPHRGARAATRGMPGVAGAMRPGSRFLTDLEAREALVAAEDRYPLVAYSRRWDLTVGTDLAEPPAADTVEIVRLDAFPLLSHPTAHRDGRIVADIVRRLTAHRRRLPS